MKLLVLSRYSRMGASSRLRTIQYADFLSNAGIEASYVGFFDDAYLNALYDPERSKPVPLKYFLKRVADLVKAQNYDCIWMEKEALPWLPYWLEAALRPFNVPVVSDYDDAIFHRYDQHANAFVRKALGDKIDRLMAASKIVFAGNPYLAQRALSAGANWVEVVPTVVDTEKYSIDRNRLESAAPRIVWVGTPNTWASHGRGIAPLMSEVTRSTRAEFFAIGAGSDASRADGIQVLPWSEASEVDDIRSMDIGVMPLTDDPFARGKCGYKLIQYMACGLPVIASPIGVNRLIVEHGVNGFLASTPHEWREALDRLLSDPDLCQSMGNKGRQKVIEQYSLQTWGPKVANLLIEATARTSSC